MNPKQRRQSILEILRQQGTYPSTNKYAKKFGTSSKTIQRDLKYLRSLGYPLTYDEHKKGWIYRQNGSFLPPTCGSVWVVLVGKTIIGVFGHNPTDMERTLVAKKFVLAQLAGMGIKCGNTRGLKPKLVPKLLSVERFSVRE